MLALAAAAQAAPKPDLTSSAPGGVPKAAGTLDGFDTSVLARNVGRGKARGSRVGFFLSKDRKRSSRDLPFAAEVKLPKLGARKRATRAGRLVIPAGAASGRWFVLACVDPAGALKESREGNNCAAARRIRVIGADPLTVAFTRHAAESYESDTAASRTLSTVGPDGAQFLFEPTQNDAEQFLNLKITPVSSISPAPGNVAPLAALLVEPAGRLLTDPGLLRIALPGGSPPKNLVGFAFDGDGAQFHLVPLKVVDGEAELQVDELGGYGVGTLKGAAPADRHVPLSPLDRLFQGVAVLQATGGLARTAGGVDQLDQQVCDYYKGELEPQLETAARLAHTIEEVAPLFHETLGLQRAAQLRGGSGNLACMDNYLDLFQRILKRVFDESYKACHEPGGDPVDEGLSLLLVARQGILLGFPEDFDSWLGAGALDKFVECSEIYYTAGYASSYSTLTTGGWASTGTTSAAGVKLRLDAPERVSTSQDTPAPGVSFSSDCSGSLFENRGGTFNIRAKLIYEERETTRVVGGKLSDEIKIEHRLIVDFFSTADVTYRIDCGGGEGLWNLAGAGSGRLIMPTAGGSESLTQDGFPKTGDDQTCSECVKITHTITLSAAARSR